MKSTFYQFCHQQEKQEKSHKKCLKTKDCGSCKKRVPEKAHKCCSNISNINFENEYYYKDNQIYSLEIDPYDPLHIVQYFPFGTPEAYEEEYAPYINDYYSYQSELYDQYDYSGAIEKKEKENEKGKQKEKENENQNEKENQKSEICHEKIIDDGDIELKLIFKPNDKPKKASKIHPKKYQKNNPKMNHKANPKMNPKKKKNGFGKKKKGKKIEVEVEAFELKREMTEKKEEPKISNEEEKFLEAFKKRILSGKYQSIDYS